MMDNRPFSCVQVCREILAEAPNNSTILQQWQLFTGAHLGCVGLASMSANPIHLRGYEVAATAASPSVSCLEADSNPCLSATTVVTFLRLVLQWRVASANIRKRNFRSDA
jgi:hypothetical protein